MRKLDLSGDAEKQPSYSGLQERSPAVEEPASQPKPQQASRQTSGLRLPRWKWALPLGIGLAGLASAAAVLFRGCWHGNMSWPVRAEDEHGHFSYQTCNDCGVMRLFDERTFRGYGPYGYELHALIAHERLLRRQRMQRAAERKAAGGKATPPPVNPSKRDSGL